MGTQSSGRGFRWAAAIVVLLFVAFAGVMLISPYIISGDYAQHGEVAIDESTFPDEELRAYVSENLDRDSDGVLSTGEREEVASIGIYDETNYAVYDRGISKLGITSLDGLEFFPYLSCVVAQDNKIAELDLSKLSRVTQVDMRGNPAFSIIGSQVSGANGSELPQVLVDKGLKLDGGSRANIVQVP